MSGHSVSEILLHGSAQATVPMKLWNYIKHTIENKTATSDNNNNNSLWEILTSPAPINYCEADYEHSSYIAEYWNTLTNIGFLLFGFYSFRQCIKYKLSSQFYIMAVTLILTAFGSGLYHGSLTWIGLKFDEIAENWVFIFLIHMKSRQIYPWLHAILASFAILFVHVFLFCELHLVGIGITTIIQNFRLIKRVPIAKSAFYRGFIYSLIGELCWLLDHLCCGTIISKFQLHSWWHIFMALCIHQLFIVAVIVHAPQSAHSINKSEMTEHSDDVRVTIKENFGLDWLTPIKKKKR